MSNKSQKLPTCQDCVYARTKVFYDRQQLREFLLMRKVTGKRLKDLLAVARNSPLRLYWCSRVNVGAWLLVSVPRVCKFFKHFDDEEEA